MSAPRLSRLALIASACTLILASSGAGAADLNSAPVRDKPRDAHSVWVTGTRDPSSWVRAESPHFVVLTDTSSASIRCCGCTRRRSTRPTATQAAS